jgi:hypothetical protein
MVSSRPANHSRAVPSKLAVSIYWLSGEKVDQLEQDLFTAKQIAAIEQFKSRTPASQGADVCKP